MNFQALARGAIRYSNILVQSNGQAHSQQQQQLQTLQNFTGWGDAVDAATVTLEPGLWSLSNFGDVLVATIANGKTFTWDSSIAARLSTRASTTNI